MQSEFEVPRFANESEAATWWEAHEDELALEFEKAVAEGRLDPDGTSLPFVSVDLDLDDIAKARVQAAERGLRYQTYLKMIIHEALRKAEVAPEASKRSV
jgi:predicted DNA binding CopG/RHH family protein